MAIFRFFKMAAAAILDFRNFKFLTVGKVKSVELRHRAKFYRNRSNRGRDTAIILLHIIFDVSLELFSVLIICSNTKLRYFSAYEANTKYNSITR